MVEQFIYTVEYKKKKYHKVLFFRAKEKKSSPYFLSIIYDVVFSSPSFYLFEDIFFFVLFCFDLDLIQTMHQSFIESVIEARMEFMKKINK